MTKILASILILTTAYAQPITAGISRVPGLQPLLRVHSQALTGVGFPPTGFIIEQRDVFVSRGGFSQATYIQGDTERVSPVLTRATSSPEALQALNRALVSSRAGIQKDCQIVGVPGGGFYDFVWYGRGGRFNQFQIRTTSSALPQLALCPREVEELLSVFFSFEAHLSDRPDSEVLVPK